MALPMRLAVFSRTFDQSMPDTAAGVGANWRNYRDHARDASPKNSQSGLAASTRRNPAFLLTQRRGMTLAFRKLNPAYENIRQPR